MIRIKGKSEKLAKEALELMLKNTHLLENSKSHKLQRKEIVRLEDISASVFKDCRGHAARLFFDNFNDCKCLIYFETNGNSCQAYTYLGYGETHTSDECRSLYNFVMSELERKHNHAKLNSIRR